MSTDVYAVILCGGLGSRLWPRSRSRHPKHLLELNGGITLVQETVKRIKLPLSRIYCVTETSHAKLLQRQLPRIPKGNIIIEPERRGTASALALALGHLGRRATPDSVVVSLHADQLIQDQAEFQRTMDAWVAAARKLPRIITLGLKPTYPSTGFGYIKAARRLATVRSLPIFGIERFVEKPSEPTAKKYVRSGDYFWNAGLFAARLGVFQAELATHLPKLTTQIKRIMATSSPAAVKRLYLKLAIETIDYGVMEKSQKLAVIPANFGWADLGSWADLHDVLERDADGNVFEGEYVDFDSHDCFVYSPRQLVATIGLDNLVIINTDDAVLICPKDRAQDVKKVVEELKSRRQTKYL